MPKIKPTEAEIALHRETGRLKQVAAHHCGAFIELSRGVQQGVVQDGRPGKEAVTRLLATVLQQGIELGIIKRILMSSVISCTDYHAELTEELAIANAKFAEDINGNKLGLLASFAFTPVADPEPKEVEEPDDGGS